jgi:hypothetical protein
VNKVENHFVKGTCVLKKEILKYCLQMKCSQSTNPMESVCPHTFNFFPLGCYDDNIPGVQPNGETFSHAT